MASEFYFLTTDLSRRHTEIFFRLRQKIKNILIIFLYPFLSACRAIALATAGVIPWLNIFFLLICNPRPPRLSPPQADDGGQARSQIESFSFEPRFPLLQKSQPPLLQIFTQKGRLGDRFGFLLAVSRWL